MGSIQTGIELRDSFSGVILGIINSVNLAVSSMYDMKQAINADIDTSSLEGVREQLNQASIAAQEFNQKMDKIATPPEPVVPKWQSDTMTVFSSSGMERYKQEIQRTNEMLNSLNDRQLEIKQAAHQMDILPPSAAKDIRDLGARIQFVREKMLELEKNPINIGTDKANNELEQLRAQLDRALQEQENMNQAMKEMDVSAANRAYLQLSQRMGGMERYVREFCQAMEKISPPPEPVVPQWKTDTMPVYSGTGMQRYRQEIKRTNEMLNSLKDQQLQVKQSAAKMNILSSSAAKDIDNLGKRIQLVRKGILELEKNPVNIGTSRASNELEQLRAQLNRALQGQENLNQAMQEMDVSAANRAYLQLSRTISGIERHIRDNTVEQEKFTGEVKRLHTPIVTATTGFKGWQKAIIVANQSLGLIKNTLGRLGITDVSGAFERMDTMDRFQRTVTTMTKDSGLANAALNTIKNNVLDTAYGLDVAGKAAQGFMTRGMELGTAADQVRIWADAVSFYGEGTNEQLESVVDAVGKMYSKGKVEADQLDRLFDAGIGAAEIYANAVGRTVGSVKDDLSDGKISAAQFINTVSEALDNGVSNGAAKEAANTWATTFANMRSAFTRGWVSVIEKTDAALAKHNLPSTMEMFAMAGKKVESVLNSVGDSMDTLIGYGVKAYDALSPPIEFIGDNLSVIIPLLATAAAMMGAYTAAVTIYNTVQRTRNALDAISTARSALHTGATLAQAAATETAAGATVGLNAALLACPVTWIVGGILLAVGALYVAIAVINKVQNKSISATGRICGAVNVVNKAIENTVHFCWNASLGIWHAFAACASNIGTAFHNGFLNVLMFFDDVVITIIDGIVAIGEALNKLPFVEFDLDGLKSAAGSWAAEKAELYGDKKDYVSVADAFNNGFHTFETFKEGWAADAYKQGYDKGSKIENFFKNFFGKKMVEKEYKQKMPELADNSNKLKEIGDNTSKISKQMEITSEDLKYIRDMAEREYVNRFTTAQITVNQTNHNTVKNDMDLDGITEHLRSTMEEQMAAAAEGVH